MTTMGGTNQTTQPPLLREFIHIPERTSTSDFVLRLTEGVVDAEVTLRDYVITDRLVDNFDEALGLIASAMGGGGSKAAYLHGSFGAGKSHFMAVLHALLRGEPAARARDEFAGLLAKHDGWLTGRRFLLVPYHLLGAKSLEQAVLGGYADYVRRLHPDAPIPAVHRTDALLDTARHLRSEIGDAKFIAGLPGGDAEDEWGESEPFWTDSQARRRAERHARRPAAAQARQRPADDLALGLLLERQGGRRGVHLPRPRPDRDQPARQGARL